MQFRIYHDKVRQKIYEVLEVEGSPDKRIFIFNPDTEPKFVDSVSVITLIQHADRSYFTKLDELRMKGLSYLVRQFLRAV